MNEISLILTIQSFMLNQRRINCSFRKETTINRSQLEILTYANTVISFNPYEAQIQFKEMNLQQVRSSIKKLALISAIELYRAGTKGKPALYMITKKGHYYLYEYQEYWTRL